MIVSLSGKLIEAGIFRAVIECAGVGYEVNIPVSTAERLPKIGETAKLFILQTFREDNQSLYGFASLEERNFFKLLIDKVSGIGPGSALKIFSRLSLPVLQNAILKSDVGLLSQCPGIGKKTAERIVIELRDKIEVASKESTTPNSSTPIPLNETPQQTDIQSDAVAALVSLGYKLTDADKAVRKAILSAGESPTIEKLIRLALGN